LENVVTLRISGADAFRYLNGQVTRDLGRFAGREWLPACILSPKGKLCAPLQIRRDGNDLLVESDSMLEEKLTARLERYVVADDVIISVESSPPIVHCFGQAVAGLEGIAVSRLGEPGVDLPATDFNGAVLDRSVVEILRIERGIPAWGAELGEETLPPEAGLDRTHIDYDRGCYPGQEVISRLKSIGRVNRLLHGFQTSQGGLRRGMVIHQEGNGVELGTLTSAADIPGEGSVALGYLPRGTAGSLCALDPLTGEKTPLSIKAILGT
jgi:folate-binding protein YgfZ